MPRKKLWVFVSLLLPVGVPGQTLTITNGVQTYATLIGTTVTMSNRCELRITGTSNPISGSTINLTSPDAWFFMLNLKPSVVVTGSLSQIQINGAAAVADSNCRVVEYGMGTVVIPHAPSLPPLTVYSGPHFTGASTNLSQYTYHKSSLGSMYANISSFKLKRGYMATLAQTENGTGISKCYVAADGDLEISVLPANFDDSVRFVYVLPWRYTAKKGIAGDPGIPLLNVPWWYNWNIDQNSSRDLEYVPIRQTRWWPGLSQDWQTRGANHLLGYNEPDSSSQANIAVGDAIWSWPDLLGTGLRVGSPATTDGGWSSWLYPFMSQADAANLRVDFVAVHYYRCVNPADPNGAANQLYNNLKAIYDATKRPIWVTEWNNGANWTGCGDPTYVQQQAAVAAMINLFDTTPFVERYALYNWVEDVRAVVTNGALTPAGVTYRDQSSPPGYVQALDSNGTRGHSQLRFENNSLDSSGYGNNGLAAGTPAYTTGPIGQAMVFDGTNTYVTLPPNVATNNAFSFAAWVYWNGGGPWQRLFDFGNSTTHYMFLTPRSGNNTLRFGIKNGGAELTVDGPQLPANQWIHVAYTQSGTTGKLYTNGVAVTTSNNVSIAPSAFHPRVNRLGKSQFYPDPLFSGRLDEVLITDDALSAGQIAGLMTNLPPQFTTSLIVRPNAVPGFAYSDTIAGEATDANGDAITYSKLSGPAWLNVATNGALSGIPLTTHGGTNEFTVRAADSVGSGFAVLRIIVPKVANNGTWTYNGDGAWGESNRWSGNVVATGIGNIADFSTIDITADRTVTLDGSLNIGALRFGDTSGAQAWTLASTNSHVLTLDSGSNVPPTIVVANTATITASLGGTNGISKSGTGTLILAGDNSFSGTLYVDSGSASADDGILRIAHPQALSAIDSVYIRNSNTASSAFQLDGTAGPILVPCNLRLNGRNSGVAAIQNLAGTNFVDGNLTLDGGGTQYLIQSDGGLLTIASNVFSVATGNRNLTFFGNGDTAFGGTLSNGAASGMSVIKSGTGKLTLGGTCTYNGVTRVNAGTLWVNTLSSTGAFTVLAGATLGGSGTIATSVTIPNGANLSPGSPAGTLTINGNLTLNNASTLTYELGAASDRVAVNGSLTLDGVLNVSDAGGFGPGSYTLFTYTGPLTDNGLALGTLPGGYDYAVVAGGGTVVLQVSSPLSAFAAWQMQYFGSTNCPACGGDADFDGDGMNNTNEFLAGTNPTNSASAFRIISILPAGDDMVVTWQGGPGKTAAVQAVAGDYSTNFTDLSAPMVIPGGGTTNYPDAGAATNEPARFYRIRLVP
jgi:autotransporter-associated beta strand protein